MTTNQTANVVPLRPVKPDYHAPDFDGIPDELKVLPNWVVWRAEPPKPGKMKWRKVPYIAQAGKPAAASTTDPNTWRGFLEAVEAYRDSQKWTRPFDGIGFVFDGAVGRDGLCCCGVDLDAWTDEAQAVFAKLATYTELSPSGDGVHAIARAKPFGQGTCKTAELKAEAYCTGRYFTFTGRLVADSIPTIEARPDEIAEVVAEIAAMNKASEAKDRAIKQDQPPGVSTLASSKPYLTQLRDTTARQQVFTQSSVFDGLPLEDSCGPDEPLNMEKFKSALWGLADEWLGDEGHWKTICLVCANEAMRNGGGLAPLKQALWEALDERSRDVEGYNEADNRDHFERFIANYGKHQRPILAGSLYQEAERQGWTPPRDPAAAAATRGLQTPGSQPKGEAMQIEPLPGASAYALTNNLLMNLSYPFSYDELHEQGLYAGEPLTDATIGRLREYCIKSKANSLHKDPTLKIVWEVAEALCDKNRFDPEKDWLDGLVWDGVPRIDTWLIDHGGAKDATLTRAISRKWLIAKVTRALNPGCQYDWALILEARQGVGKTIGFRALAGTPDRILDHPIMHADPQRQQEVAETGSNVGLLASEWRQFFFPTADDAQFADAYAQTVTYAMLLARLSGAAKLEPAEAAKTLNKGNGLLAETLKLLGQDGARAELRVGFELLQRSLEALQPATFLKTKPDLWLYFYEDFLAAYDPQLRKDYGVYYTPREVVELQVRLASELLDKRFNKKLGFADDGVVFIDPAVGTGTYLVAAIKNALDKVRAKSGVGQVAPRAAHLAEHMLGFEILVGPYAVAHLRLTQALEGAMNENLAQGEPPSMLQGRLKVYLADTLESPEKAPPGGLDLTHRALTQEHEAARKIKKDGEILVCLGNPPYDRQHIEEGDTATQRKGGWVRFGDQVKGGAKPQEQLRPPIFEDFLEPARRAGTGVHLKNLYNDYVYFWRWALWRLFEQQNCGGIVTFITASSYLAGPGFIGMREVMRRTFDELWILDLGGDNHGTRKSPNVFNIETPVAVAVGVRGSYSAPDMPAKVHYARILGDTPQAKRDQLKGVVDLTHLAWKPCPDDWHAPFLPVGKGNFFEWAALSDLMPLALNGAQFKRHWPIGETEDVLSARWQALMGAKPAQRATLFRETKGWKITKTVGGTLPGAGEPSIYAASALTKRPAAIKYSYRSFDRHLALYDFRLGDRLRPSLYRLHGDTQLYFTTLLMGALSNGPALVAAAAIPDLHHFRGSLGGRGVIPLYRDAAATEPNVTAGLLERLGNEYGATPSEVDLAAYLYAVLGGQSYTQRFWNELETPGPRVPLTKDRGTFSEAVAHGRRLIWLHTYAHRLQGDGRGAEVPSGNAKSSKGVSTDPARYPEVYEYDHASRELRVGDGRFGPVEPDVWEFEVSGLKVVQSWLGYRMRNRAGKKSSALDDIRPERWTPRMTDDLLELLWVLEATLKMEPELSMTLDKIVAGACFKASELPTPSVSERKPPSEKLTGGGLLGLMEGNEGDGENAGDAEDEEE